MITTRRHAWRKARVEWLGPWLEIKGPIELGPGFGFFRAQQLMLEHVAKSMGEAPSFDPSSFASAASQWPMMNLFADPAKIAILATDGVDRPGGAVAGTRDLPDEHLAGRAGLACRHCRMTSRVPTAKMQRTGARAQCVIR